MDGLCLASAGDDIKLWDCDHGFSLSHTFNPHCNRNIASLSWNFDGSMLASCALESEQVTVTCTRNAIGLTTVDLPCGAGVQCTDFSSASRLLLCGGAEGVSVWDLKTKALKKSFQEHKGPVTTARYNWNNSYIASGSESGEIILHNMVTGQSSSPLVAPNVQAIRQLEYSAFKKSMFGTASDDGAVTLWDANTRRMLHSFKDAHVGPATGLAFSPINEMLMISVGLDKRFVCYDIQRKHIMKVYDAQSPLTCIDIMPDGATVAVGSTRGKVYIYDLRQGGSTPIHIFQAHKTSVHSVRFMPPLKSKNESSSGSKTNVSTTSGSRRQLPPAPTIMQDITPSKTGQTPDSEPVPQAVSPALNVDLFSPTSAQGNQSHQHSKSASNFNLTSSRGEDSFAGVFSPLTKGAAELSAVSQSGLRDSSLFSLPSFIGQSNSNTSCSAVEPTSQHNASNMGKSAGKGQFSLPHHINSLHTHTNEPALHQSSNIAAGHLSHNVTAGHLSHNVTAGHLSHLQQSSTVHSPVVGQLSHPQMCSSLQGSTTEATSRGVGSDQSQSAGSGLTAQPVTETQDMDPLADPRNRSRASASPDSAAISGGEDGEAGLSPRRDTSQSSAPATYTRSHPAETNATGSTAAGPVDYGASSEAGITQRKFLKSLVADAMEDVRDDLHRDIQGLHVSMLRQFHNFEREIQSTLSHYAEMNQKLLVYVRQLEEENKRLKKNY